MKKIYIAGCGGMSGGAFYDRFKKKYELKCTDIDVNEDWLSFLDFRDFKKYREDVMDFKPDFLFHLGAHTDLEYCEKNPDDAYMTNTLSVENAVNIANELDIPIFYVGTAGIFDGKKDMYDDWEIPTPLSVYARSKYLGERVVLETAKHGLVCRAGWMIGGGPKKDKKYIHKIMEQIKNGSKELSVVRDKGGIPTYTRDFAANVEFLIENNQRGLYNMVCQGEITDNRLEVTKELIKILGLEDKVKVTSVDSEHFKKEYWATRPSAERLENKKLKLRGLNKMRNWKVALKEYLEQDYEGYLD
ncbi:sugar nucleotide-binding protein [Candidatus Pacearchaeota archaeon]|nr:sugar nucleotide-binding protein [Candidatus Pacearchaeota archaeon]